VVPGWFAVIAVVLPGSQSLRWSCWLVRGHCGGPRWFAVIAVVLADPRRALSFSLDATGMMAFFTSNYGLADDHVGTTIGTWRVPCAAGYSPASLSEALSALRAWQSTDGPKRVSDAAPAFCAMKGAPFALCSHPCNPMTTRRNLALISASSRRPTLLSSPPRQALRSACAPCLLVKLWCPLNSLMYKTTLSYLAFAPPVEMAVHQAAMPTATPVPEVMAPKTFVSMPWPGSDAGEGWREAPSGDISLSHVEAKVRLQP
jgi:hypothetical protein